MVRGGHTQGGSRNAPLALLTGHFHSNTHTISVRAETTSLISLTGIPSPLPPPPLSPLTLTLPYPSHLTIISQLIRELLVIFCQSQLEAPVSSNHQEPGRLQEGEGGGEGAKKEGGERWVPKPLSVVSTTSWSQFLNCSISHPSHCHKPPLTSCSVPAPPWSAHSAALITNCRLLSVGEADHLLQEKANTPLSMARCTHNWSSTVRLYRGRAGRAGGRGLVMQYTR